MRARIIDGVTVITDCYEPEPIKVRIFHPAIILAGLAIVTGALIGALKIWGMT